MAADPSAYSVLGLEPGADWELVERTYKALISRHHPDRSGGDEKRAAEITAAYRELRRARDYRDGLELADDGPDDRRRTRTGLWLVGALVAGAAGLVVASTEPSAHDAVRKPLAGLAEGKASKGESDDVMDRPLSVSAIDQSVRNAVHIAATRDEMALADSSRDCHRQLRSIPSIEQLDRCAAFDDAVVQLQDRDPLRDQGPFSEIAVTGRQMSAASALSDDSLAIDGRLDRIRLHVELALAPALPPMPEAPPAAN
jgi:hypothetical protein